MARNLEKQREYNREYRARKKEKGERVARGKGAPMPSRFARGQFIALDGEGESLGEVEVFHVGKDKREYKCQGHFYTLLAASSGEALFNGGKRLETQAAIDWLLELGATYKHAIFVIFAGGYDINHILMHGFDKEFLKKVSHGEAMRWKVGETEYEIEYRARKSLTLRRGLSFTQHPEKKTWRARWDAKIVVWDVFGFFQENFVGVMGKWLGKDWKHFELIKKMKAQRGDFSKISQSEINAYNSAELESLVAIMEKVRDSIEGLDLMCQRWDGAGAVAASLMRKHTIKEFKRDTAEDIQHAIRCAYAGGRIEVCKIGVHRAPVFDYDVNSAYPTVMAGLPCLAHGRWIYGKGEPPKGFTVVKCRYDFVDDMPFYPLFFRNENMQICFPAQGCGWYWLPEYEAAQKMAGICEAIEWYSWQPECNHKPFHWIQDYYKTRQQWVKNPLEGWQSGGEKIIKLGLNSLYGKTAQQLGGLPNKPPVYHQLEWAGYITSATRARLFEAAITRPHSIIGFATDGIFCTEELPIECSTEKAMGAWELKQPVPEGMTIAMAGVYWWHYPENQYGHFSRGFDKDFMKTPDRIIEAWKNGEDFINISMQRLIGLGSACSSDMLWKMRGRFVTTIRQLRLNGNSHKRVAIDVKKSKPHEKLVDLKPAINVEYISEILDCSFPYPIRWLDEDLTEEYKGELEEIRENVDTENI